MRIKLIVIMLMLVLSACKKDDEGTSVSNSKSYFPLSEGKEWVDSIKSIWIDSPSNVYDTTIIIQKTVVDSIISIDSKDKIYCTSYRLENESWTVDHVFWYELTNTQLIRFEDNMIWLDLVFPLTQGKEWNPYAYNIYSDTTLRNVVYEIDKFRYVNNVPYDSTLIIHHQMDSTLIYKYTEKSIYANGYGLLSKQKVAIISDDPNYDYTLPIEERIKTGQFISVKRLYNYETN
jgi:hypothetical protein